MRRLVDALKKIYRKVPPPPSTNYLYRKGSYAFGSPPEDAKVLCVDMQEGPGVDIVADAHDLHMVPNDAADLVTSVSVLEHVRHPERVMQEIYRILRPGGIVYINVPFVFPFHADPDDFYRFSYKGIEILCERFERIDSGF